MGLEFHSSVLLVPLPKLNGTTGIPLSLCSELASSELSVFAIGVYSVALRKPGTLWCNDLVDRKASHK